MSGNAIFNATVCIIGIGILLIHAINVFVKKDRPKDGTRLLTFLLFTVFHFATYLTFTLIKAKYTSDPYIISFYTIFTSLITLKFCYFSFTRLNISDLKRRRGK